MNGKPSADTPSVFFNCTTNSICRIPFELTSNFFVDSNQLFLMYSDF